MLQKENFLDKRSPGPSGAPVPRPELDLLLCCARVSIDTETAARIRVLLREQIDWAFLVRVAVQHRMLALLYRNLSTVSADAVPQDILDQLRDFFHLHSRHNFFLTGELIKLVELFRAEEIFAVPFKGPVLSALAYGDLSLRVFFDLDILVPRQDALRAKGLLTSHGYLLQTQLTDGEEAAYLRSGCQLQFVREDGGVTVDLHWELADWGFPLSSGLDGLWERLEPVSIAGRNVFSLSPEDLLLFLCVHGAKHRWVRLEWICDVAELIRAHPGLDWRLVMENARRLRCERVLLLGLLLANDLLGVNLSQEVWQRIQVDPTAQSLAAHARKELFSETNALLMEADRWGFYFRMRERLRDKMRTLLYLIHSKLRLTSEDLAFLPLPAFLSFFYYLLRPIRLVRVYGVSPVIRFLKSFRSF